MLSVPAWPRSRPSREMRTTSRLGRREAPARGGGSTAALACTRPSLYRRCRARHVTHWRRRHQSRHSGWCRDGEYAGDTAEGDVSPRRCWRVQKRRPCRRVIQRLQVFIQNNLLAPCCRPLSAQAAIPGQASELVPAAAANSGAHHRARRAAGARAHTGNFRVERAFRGRDTSTAQAVRSLPAATVVAGASSYRASPGSRGRPLRMRRRRRRPAPW